MPEEFPSLDTEVRPVVTESGGTVATGLDSTVDDIMIGLEPASVVSLSDRTFWIVEVTAQVLDSKEVGMGLGMVDRT